MKGVRPITKDEFSRKFRRCTPPRVGWPPNIGVANSGGPDSTCLLFLIHRYLSDQTNGPNHPLNVVSLTIDHDLQVSSSAMADHCSKVARSFGVKHLTTKIPWSVAPFPERPLPGEAFENTARDARYHSLFQAMTRESVGVLAFGHHSDDQVETSLMRLGRGSTEIGAAGMRPCRRWGMGLTNDERALGWAGYEGMNRWIIRPLLDVNKDRILATCEANGLEYITDETNFQPHITLRNALRQRIQGNRLNTSQEIPTDIKAKLTCIEDAVSSLESVSVTLDDGPQHLRSAINVLSANIEDIDGQVNSLLNFSKLPSFPGTFLISSRAISSVRDQTLRRAIILRILRYVSFHPWGTLRAEGKRRMASIDQIVSKVWDPNPFRSKSRMFVAGAGVLWTPVAAKGSHIKTPDMVNATGLRQEDEILCWLASRQPPLSRQKMTDRAMLNPLEIDVTDKIIGALRQGNDKFSVVHVLWDCRYLIRFDLKKMPPDLVTRLLFHETEKIMIYPNTRWYWPKVVWETKDTSDVLHSEINKKQNTLFLLEEQPQEKDMTYWRPKKELVSSNWINIEWVRSLDAI